MCAKLKLLKNVVLESKEGDLKRRDAMELTAEDIEILNANLVYLQKMNDLLPAAVVRELKNYLSRKDEYLNEKISDISYTFDEFAEKSTALQAAHNEDLINIGKVVTKATNIIIDSIPKGKKDSSYHIETEKLKTPSGFKNWLKFLFYDCPKYSFSKPIRHKFLYQLADTCRLLFTVWAVAFLLIIANDNHHLRFKIAELQRTEQKYNLLRKESKAVKSWADKAEEIENNYP